MCNKRSHQTQKALLHYLVKNAPTKAQQRQTKHAWTKDKTETVRLTEVVLLVPFVAALFVDVQQKTPEMIDNDEGRS